MENLNHHQMVIINNLTFTESARFAELNTERLPSDQFNYHIKTLLQNGLIEKDNTGNYALSLQGRKFSSETDIYNFKIEKQAKIHLGPVCRKVVNGEHYFLMHKRTKHPYFGWTAFPTGKAKWGNDFSSEVIRELFEETGLTGTPVLKAILHNRVRLPGSDEIVDDKLFYYYLINDMENELLEKTIEGENFWLSLEDIKNKKKISLEIFEQILWIIDSMDQNAVVFKETIGTFEKI